MHSATDMAMLGKVEKTRGKSSGSKSAVESGVKGVSPITHARAPKLSRKAAHGSKLREEWTQKYISHAESIEKSPSSLAHSKEKDWEKQRTMILRSIDASNKKTVDKIVTQGGGYIGGFPGSPRPGLAASKAGQAGAAETLTGRGGASEQG